jgi:hypothetical protein
VKQIIRSWSGTLRLVLGLVVGAAVVLALLHTMENGVTPAAAAAPAPATQPAAKTFPVEGGYAQVTFKDLSGFRLRIKYLEKENGDVTVEPGTVLKQVPAAIQALDGKPVALRGFMMAVEIDESKVKKFLFLSVVPGCLYCNPPQLHEYIVTTMKTGAKLPAPSDDPLLVKGTLHVHEEVVEGVVASIYQMDAESVVQAPGESK